MVVKSKWVATRETLDALRIQFYSSRYSEGPMFRAVSLIWQIQVGGIVWSGHSLSFVTVGELLDDCETC